MNAILTDGTKTTCLCEHGDNRVLIGSMWLYRPHSHEGDLDDN